MNKKADFKDWHACHDCNIKMGGEVPKYGHQGITMTGGTCPYCGTKDAVLIPHTDYHWPKKGRRAIWD